VVAREKGKGTKRPTNTPKQPGAREGNKVIKDEGVQKKGRDEGILKERKAGKKREADERYKSRPKKKK